MKTKINYQNRLDWTPEPGTYEHMIRHYCSDCGTDIKPENYLENGNYCLGCCMKATRLARERVIERQEMELLRGVDNSKQVVRTMI